MSRSNRIARPRKPSRKHRRESSRKLRLEALEDRRLLAVLFADSFETSEWNGAWVEDAQNDWFRSTHRASDGSYAAEVDGSALNATLTMANPIDLSGQGDVEVDFSWYIEKNWDSGEYLAVDLYDGGGWSEVASLKGNIDQENAWQHETISVAAQYLVDDFKIRFRAQVSGRREDGHVDNVKIVGTPNDSQFAINDVQLAEGDSGSSNLVFTVTRSGDTSGVSSVDFATANGTATTADGDYVATTGVVEFLAGETTKTISVQVNGDTEFEPNETLTVGLTNAVDATILDDQGQGTIVNDDTPPPTISISDATATEGEQTVEFIDEFVTSMSGGLQKPRHIAFGPDGHLYVASQDTNEVLRYDGTSGNFLNAFVPAGSGGLAKPWAMVFGSDGNLYVSGNESNNVLRYSGATGAFIDEFITSGLGGLKRPKGMTFGPNGDLFVSSPDDAGAGITGPDEVLRYDGTTGEFIEVFVTDASGGLDNPNGVTFGPDGNFYVADTRNDRINRYDGASGEYIDIFVTSQSGGIDIPTDIQFRDGLLYVAGQGSASINRYDATTGAFVDQIVPEGSGGLASAAGFTFDTDGNIYVAGGTTSPLGNNVLRYGPVLAAPFTVQLSTPSPVPVTVNFGTADDTAMAGSDYTTTSGSLTFAPGVTQRSFLVPILDNAIDEPSERFFVNLSSATGAVIGDAQGIATIEDNDGATGPNLAHGVVTANDNWQTVTLPSSYDSMVVVATPNYDVNSPAGVVQIRNAAGNSFEVRVESTDLTNLFDTNVHYVVVEEGVYDEADYKLEAVKFTSTVTDENNSWVGQSRSYQQSYVNPVVVGQVMTHNDTGWSVFWAAGGSRTSAPTSSTLTVGKHVGEDPDATRADETIGYLVIETNISGTAEIEGLPYVAAVGADTVKGVGNAPSYNYTYNAMPNSKAVVASQAGMDGANGSWAVLYGNDPITATGGTLKLAVDEDQARDSERKHTTEQVAYFIIDPPPDADAAQSIDSGKAADRLVAASAILLDAQLASLPNAGSHAVEKRCVVVARTAPHIDSRADSGMANVRRTAAPMVATSQDPRARLRRLDDFFASEVGDELLDDELLDSLFYAARFTVNAADIPSTAVRVPRGRPQSTSGS